MTGESLRAIALRWIEEGWQRGSSPALEAMHSPRFVDHDAAGRPSDRAGFVAGVERLYAAFPDFHAEVTDLVVDAARGMVAVRWRAEGTHRGPYLGLPPRGRRIRFKGIEVIRVEDGLVVERWGEWDGLDLLAQMRDEPGGTQP